MHRFLVRPLVGRLLITVALVLTLPLVGGLLLDWLLGASPLWTAVGVSAGSLVGAAVVCRRMHRVLDTYLPAEDNEDEGAAEANESPEA